MLHSVYLLQLYRLTFQSIIRVEIHRKSGERVIFLSSFIAFVLYEQLSIFQSSQGSSLFWFSSIAMLIQTYPSIATLAILDFKTEFHTIWLTLQQVFAINGEVRITAFWTCTEPTDLNVPCDTRRSERSDGLRLLDIAWDWVGNKKVDNRNTKASNRSSSTIKL